MLDKTRRFYKDVYQMMVSSNITINNLRKAFQSGSGFNETLPLDQFIKTLLELDFGHKLDRTLVTEIV